MKSPTKGSFVVLLLAMVLSYAAAIGYTLFFNPEVQFWKAAYEKKSEWAKELSAKGPKTVFVGGSSCAFQVDAGLLTTEYNLPSVNMGFHAGSGATAILALGLSVISPGDKLVLYMEPVLMFDPAEQTQQGYQILAATGLLFKRGPHWRALNQFSLGDILSSMRPGLYNTVTMLAKLMANRPLYRYGVEDLRHGGAMSTEMNLQVDAMTPGPLVWNRETSQWLAGVTFDIEANEQIKSFYLLPLGLFRSDRAEEARGAFRDFLAHAPKAIRPINDPALGVATNPGDFADSAQHLNRDAMIQRTKEVAEILAQKKL